MLWNQLSTEAKSAESLNSFKRHIRTQFGSCHAVFSIILFITYLASAISLGGLLFFIIISLYIQTRPPPPLCMKPAQRLLHNRFVITPYSLRFTQLRNISKIYIIFLNKARVKHRTFHVPNLMQMSEPGLRKYIQLWQQMYLLQNMQNMIQCMQSYGVITLYYLLRDSI